MFIKKVVVVSLISIVLLFVCAALYAADDPWVLKVLVTDTDGMYSSGTCRIGFRDTSIGAVGPGPCPPGSSLAVGIDWIDELTSSIFDYRPTDSEYPQTWNFSLYYTGSEAIDPLQVVIAPSSTMPYPYSVAGNLGIEWYDGESWQSAVYDGDNQLTAEGLSFTIAGTPDFSYSSPNLIITAGTSEQRSLARPSQPTIPYTPSLNAPAPVAGSRDTLKWLPNGAPVSINGAIVSARFDYGFYVERSDRSFGIWVSAPDEVYDGDLVDITGRMAIGGGERAVVADQDGVTALDYNYPRPMETGLNNRNVGGGAVGSWTPAIANSAGLNNTGLLVKVWGTVTYVDSTNRIFYLDDGSNVSADGGHVGVKVYDTTYDQLPSVNSFQVASGVSSAEIPSGSSASIRVVRKTYPVTHPSQEGSGTISGSITPTGASGMTVRVYCAGASTTSTFSGNTASYTLSVPYGDHAVTATMLGYRTTTQLASLYSWNSSVTLNFTLPTIQRRIDVLASPWRIPPDGTSQTTLTAIVRDEEGRRLGGETVSWDHDLGTLQDAVTTTDNVGEATATLTSTTNHETATVSVTSGSVVGYGYAEYADAGDPYIRITEPTPGASLTGTAQVSAIAHDTDADGSTGLAGADLLVDGLRRGSVSLNSDVRSGLDTEQLTNGSHALVATAKDAKGNSMRSQVVPIDVSNAISTVGISQTALFRDRQNPGQFTISGYLNGTGSWTVQITNSSEATVYSASGGAGSFQCSWDGKIGGNYVDGLYTVTISSGSTVIERDIAISAATGPLVLISAQFSNEAWWSRSAARAEVNAVIAACEDQYLYYTLIPDPQWETWGGVDGMSYWLTNGYRYWFHTGHGDEVQVPGGSYRAVIVFTGSGDEVVYGNDYYALPEDRPNILAVSDLNINPYRYHIVMLNSCWSAGWVVHGVDHSIANAFGIYGAVDADQVFLGWNWMYKPLSFPLGMSGTVWTQAFWSNLGRGDSVGQAIAWANYQTMALQAAFLVCYGGESVTWLTQY